MAKKHNIKLLGKRVGYWGQECRDDNGELVVSSQYYEGLVVAVVVPMEGYEAMEKLLKSEDCPTGIYCANDITAVGILKYLRKCRNLYFTPSIIASDDIEEAQFTKPMLTTVGLPKEEMGRFALYLLLDRMKGGHSGVVRMELSGKLLVRNSCSHVSESFWSDYCI